MPDTTPQLGYGQRSEAPIDAVNQWMRSQPWYQTRLAEWGQSPDNVHLSDAQKEDLVRVAQAHGVVVDEGHDGQEIDDSGNFRAKGHKLRNTLIVAGIAGAALATMGAAGVFSGAAGAAGGAAGGTGAAAGGLGGVEAGVMSGLGSVALPGAGTALSAGSGLAGLAGASGATAAGLGGVEAGATSGLSAALPGAGTALPELPGVVTGAGIDGVEGATGSTSSFGSRLAQLSKITNGVNDIMNNGQDPALVGTGAANAAAQAARNRILGAQVDLGGPAADKTALSNMRTAGLMAGFKPTEATPYGSPAISLGKGTTDFASQFQQELQKRMTDGKSLTLSGVPAPTQQELDDEATARRVSQGLSPNTGTIGKVINGVNTGVRIANLIPAITSLWK